MEYMITNTGLKRIIKDVYQILDNEKLDTRNRLAALQLLTMVYKALMELTADGTIIEQAIEKIKQIKQQTPPQQEIDENATELVVNEEELEEDAAEAEAAEE
jgi:hypothetical protein